jgi:membrane associated rhomboid family serine protease
MMKRAADRAVAGSLGGAIMGIYDREYYRDETRGSGFFSGAAPVCKAIILTNVAIFLASLLFPDALDFFHRTFEANSREIFHGWQVHRLITAAFLHLSPQGGAGGGLWHILVNMCFLWMAGSEMEAMYGSRDFLMMYLTACVVSSLCWAGADAFTGGLGLSPMNVSSGAVTAVAVLYTLYYPHRDVMLFGLIRVEIWMLLALYLGLNFVTMLQQLQNGSAFGVAFSAQLGGAAYGYLFKAQDLRWSRLLAPRQRRPRLRVVSPESRDKVTPLSTSSQGSRSASTTSSRPTSTIAFPEELDARLDEVLAKIAREGRSGLTEEEKQVLQEASQRARDRRSDRP